MGEEGDEGEGKGEEDGVVGLGPDAARDDVRLQGSVAPRAVKRARRGQVNRSVVPTPPSLALVVYQPPEGVLLGQHQQPEPSSSMAL